MTKVVAIHQPNFFPWLGYFDKIARADVFIALDDVQISKTGGGWCNRVKLFIAGEPRWVTAPLQRNYSGVRAIREIAFDDRKPWRENLLKTLRANYARAPHFNEASALLHPLILNECPDLAGYNLNAIRGIATALSISPEKIRLASELTSTGTATERLIELTKGVGGNAYMCGGGAGGYQEDALFEAAQIGLIYQNFAVKSYPQFWEGAFVAGLSIIDALMHLGVAATADFLRSGTPSAPRSEPELPQSL
ncbi:MAG TPA: WbqC family protein [Terrimicrobiaceae bacterium]|nr:WbqC family protein [Terrimicrobiaceae bacterium]